MKISEQADRCYAALMLRVIHKIRNPSEADIDLYLKIKSEGKDPDKVIFEYIERMNDFKNKYPLSPGDDVSSYDMVNHGYWKDDE